MGLDEGNEGNWESLRWFFVGFLVWIIWGMIVVFIEMGKFKGGVSCGGGEELRVLVRIWVIDMFGRYISEVVWYVVVR